MPYAHTYSIYVYIYLYIYIHGLLPIKKNEIMSFAATWVDLEIIIWSEVNQTETNMYHLYITYISLIYTCDTYISLIYGI